MSAINLGWKACGSGLSLLDLLVEWSKWSGSVAFQNPNHPITARVYVRTSDPICPFYSICVNGATWPDSEDGAARITFRYILWLLVITLHFPLRHTPERQREKKTPPFHPHSWLQLFFSHSLACSLTLLTLFLFHQTYVRHYSPSRLPHIPQLIFQASPHTLVSQRPQQSHTFSSRNMPRL